jgi:hypothetical protein
MDELFESIINAAEKTADQASGNDKKDWGNFVQALRDEWAQFEENKPEATPHEGDK